MFDFVRQLVLGVAVGIGVGVRVHHRMQLQRVRVLVLRGIPIAVKRRGRRLLETRRGLEVGVEFAL